MFGQLSRTKDLTLIWNVLYVCKFKIHHSDGELMLKNV